MSASLQSDVVLKTTVDELMTAGLSQGTHNAYNSGLRSLQRFTGLACPALAYAGKYPPLTEEILNYFVAHCYKVSKLRHSTIKLYLAGIRHAYIVQGLPNPLVDLNGQALLRLQLILRGIKKSQTAGIKPRLPITYDILQNFLNCLEKGVFGLHVDSVMQTMCTIGFFGFLRCGEMTCKYAKFDPVVDLTMQDVQFTSSSSMSIQIKASKTDPFRQGITLHFFQMKPPICPVRMMSIYFRNRMRLGGSHDSPLFIDSKGNAVSRDFFIRHLKMIMSRLGFDQAEFSGHSLRIGAATTASNTHVQDHLIKIMGRWTSDSYCRYIRTPLLSLRAAHASLCGENNRQFIAS